MAIREWRVSTPVPARELFAWHARDGAFERLLPPWENITVLERTGGIENGGRLVMKLRKGPIALEWHALHRDYIAGEQFVDEQVKGPFGKWVHTHRFLPEGEDRSILWDHVEYRLPLAPLSTLFGAGIARRQVERLFAFRHLRTLRDLARHAAATGGRPLRIAITGARGFVGQALSTFLTTGGHEVVRLVRQPARKADEIGWDPRNGEIDAARIEGLDGLVHLAGENVGERRWTPEVKQEIRESRVRSNGLLARTLGALKRPPAVLVVAGGAGIYGDRGLERVDEDSETGEGFLAEVGREAEAALAEIDESRTRVVPLRIGLVLGAKGGVLGKLTPLFRFGLGGPLGDGRQSLAWIGLDDLVGVIHRALVDPSLVGPVNAVAGSVSNRQFARVLGKVCLRPAVLPAPALALRAGLGERADALLLTGATVEPSRLRSVGFPFLNDDLEAALRWELQGRG